MNNRLNLEKLVKGFVSSDELKPALMGVCYDIDKKNLCATDGHKLFVLKECQQHINIVFQKDPGFKVFPGEAVTLPVEIFTEYEKRTKDIKNNAYRLEACRLLITGAGTTEKPYFVEYQFRKHENNEFKTFAGAECLDERYPDYQSVIPAKNDRGAVDAIQVNPVYLNMMYQAVKSWEPKGFPHTKLLFKNDIAPVMVEFFGDETERLDYDCLLMPIRIS